MSASASRPKTIRTAGDRFERAAYGFQDGLCARFGEAGAEWTGRIESEVVALRFDLHREDL